MGRHLRVLIVEDSEGDARLLALELERCNFNPAFLRVDTMAELESALKEHKWDLVISDYCLPEFNGIDVLKKVRKFDLDLPFILVSGHIGEEVAVEVMKAGAQDYIMKGNLARLAPAVEREIREARERRRRKKAETRADAQKRELEVLAALNAASARSTTLDQLLGELLDRVVEFFEQDIAGALFLLEADRENLVLRAHRLIDADTAREAAIVRLEEMIPDHSVIRERPLVWDAARFPLDRLRPIIARNGYMALVSMPLFSAGEMVGALCLATQRERSFTHYELELLNTIGKYLGASIRNMQLIELSRRELEDRKRSEEKIRRANRFYALLSQINQAVVQTDERRRLFSKICDVMVEFGHFGLAWIALIDEANGRIEPVAISGGKEGGLEKFRAALDVGALADCPVRITVSSGEHVFYGDVQAECKAPWKDAILTGGYHSCFSLPLKLHGKTIGALVLCSGEMDSFDEDERNLLVEIAADVSFALDKMDEEILRKKGMDDLKLHVERLSRTFEGTVLALASATELRDPYTAGHQRRVAALASAIATRMGLSEVRIDGIHVAGVLHDIGKIAVPAEILSKPSKLSSIEFGLVQTHSRAGYDILKIVEFPWPVAQIALQHHERLDGTGYPYGLLGDEISMEARIMAVADVVEAMASHRPYRSALGVEVALEEIGSNQGRLYDVEVVLACLKIFSEDGFSFV